MYNGSSRRPARTLSGSSSIHSPGHQFSMHSIFRSSNGQNGRFRRQNPLRSHRQLTSTFLRSLILPHHLRIRQLLTTSFSNLPTSYLLIVLESHISSPHPPISVSSSDLLTSPFCLVIPQFPHVTSPRHLKYPRHPSIPSRQHSPHPPISSSSSDLLTNLLDILQSPCHRPISPPQFSLPSLKCLTSTLLTTSNLLVTLQFLHIDTPCHLKYPCHPSISSRQHSAPPPIPSSSSTSTLLPISIPFVMSQSPHLDIPHHPKSVRHPPISPPRCSLPPQFPSPPRVSSLHNRHSGRLQ